MTDKICVIGMGYVGLPLAIAFDKEFSTLGFEGGSDGFVYVYWYLDVYVWERRRR